MKKSVFITGGTYGLGHCLANEFLKRGYRVGVCARNISSFVQKNTTGLEVYKADITSIEEMREALKLFTGDTDLDIFIANAGITNKDKAQIPDFDIARKIIQTNLLGTINSLEVALEHMLPKKQGHLVAISSVASLFGVPGLAAYSGSKSSINRICESLNIDLKASNIDVSCILPGTLDTPMNQTNNYSPTKKLSPKIAAVKFVNAIERRKSLYYYPKQTYFKYLVFSLLPNFISRLILKNIHLQYSTNTKGVESR